MALIMRDREILEESMESPCYISQGCVTQGLTEQPKSRIKKLISHWVMETGILCIPSIFLGFILAFLSGACLGFKEE